MATGLISSAHLPTDLAAKSFAAMITRLMPNGNAPLFALTSLLKDETASALEHGYYTATMIFPSLQIDNGAGYTTGDTSFTVDAYSDVVTRYVNYTQIFRNSWAVTKTLAALPLIAGDGAVAESKRDCAAFHALAIEKALFFGQKFQGTRNSMPFQTMEGIVARVTTAASGNITTLGSTTNWTQLEAALDPTLAVQTDATSGNIRTMFVGGVARRVVHNIARLNSTYQITGVETSWGMQIDTIKTPRGTFEMIEHPLFNAYGNASTWSKMAVVVDLNAFAIAYLRRTEEKNYNDSGTPVDSGIDAQGGTLTTELTCLIKNPAAFGILYNFTAAAAG